MKREKVFLALLIFLGFETGLIFFMTDNFLDNLSNQRFFIAELGASKQEAAVEADVYLPFFEAEKEKLTAGQTDFIYVNLSEMKLAIFKKGESAKEFSILTRGDPESWGGSAVGLYKVLSGYVSAYSVVSEVYMPFALNYYGKYWLHGRPLDEYGQKFISPVSGGCLQFSDEDAKEIYENTEINMPVLVVDEEADGYKYEKKNISDFPVISTQKYLVADLKSGYVFKEKDSEGAAPVASLSKLMTALVVAENIDLQKRVLIKPEMLVGFGETEGIEQGELFGVVELFYPLLIESSNDAALALAGFMGMNKTLGLMNEKTKSIMMESAVFIDPTGFDPGNLASAKDLFYLARYIFLNRPPIFKITKSEEVPSFVFVRYDVKKLWNKNIFSEDPAFLGGKTGFIKESRYTGIFLFKMTAGDGAERNVVIILLGSDDLKSDTQKIYQWLLENYFNGGSASEY